METARTLEWLLGQSGIAVVLGLVIYWLKGRYEKSEDEKSDLAKEVIKLTVLWEQKSDSDREISAETRKVLIEIKEMLEKWKQ